MEVKVKVTSPFIMDDDIYELGDITMLDINIANPLIQSGHVDSLGYDSYESVTHKSNVTYESKDKPKKSKDKSKSNDGKIPIVGNNNKGEVNA